MSTSPKPMSTWPKPKHFGFDESEGFSPGATGAATGAAVVSGGAASLSSPGLGIGDERFLADLT